MRLLAVRLARYGDKENGRFCRMPLNKGRVSNQPRPMPIAHII